MKNLITVILLFSGCRVFAQGLNGVSELKRSYLLQDSITDFQTDVSFNSVSDGQPAPPRMPFYSLSGSAQSGNQYHYQFNLGYTPYERGFMRNSLFSLIVPALDAGEGITDVERSMGLSWLQRWTWEHDGFPTISSMVSLLVPFIVRGLKTNVVVTFIVAKDLPRGVLYFNAYGESKKGLTTDSLDYGLLGGCRMNLHGSKSLTLDVLYQRSSVITFETSFEFDLNKGWTIGPGVNVSYDNNTKGTAYGVGIIFFRQTSKKLFHTHR
ncbi:MAG TPA: hypothetical protein VJ963_13380 [Bacteroidales bacterium]|nr:hypothetical protein [Bacteroidales bacterium]